MHSHILPTRIESAFRALAYVHSVEVGGTVLTPNGPVRADPRQPSPAEEGLRNSAAETLRNYITGEINIRTPRESNRSRTRQTGQASGAPIEPEAEPDDFPDFGGCHP